MPRNIRSRTTASDDTSPIFAKDWSVVNLFVVGWSPLGPVDGSAAERALRALLDRLPFFEGITPHTWTSASKAACAACVSHPTSQTSGIRYAHFDPEHLALYSGRPFRWASDGTAEGRG